MRITLPSGSPAELARPSGASAPSAAAPSGVGPSGAAGPVGDASPSEARSAGAVGPSGSAGPAEPTTASAPDAAPGASASGAPGRGLVIVPDVGDLRPLFAEMAQHLADENGWVVCAIGLWGDRDDVPTLADRLAAGGTLDDARVLGDAVAAADATGCDEVAIVGFCMGGMYALKASGTGRFVRAASFYGMARVPDMWKSPTQGEPLDAVTRPGACPALEVVGTVDSWVPAEDADALEAAGVEVVRYEGADHGFVHDASRPAHRPDDAADAWRRVIAHLSA